MTLFGDPEFWVAAAGAIFLAVVWRPARRVLLGSLDERAARIRGELDEARRLREEAEQLLVRYQQQRRDAEAEAQAIVAHAEEEARRIADAAARDLEQSLARRQRLAEERIAQAEGRVLDEIRGAAVDVAVAAARQVIATQLDEKHGGALIDSAIAALPQRLR